MVIVLGYDYRRLVVFGGIGHRNNCASATEGLAREVGDEVSSRRASRSTTARNFNPSDVASEQPALVLAMVMRRGPPALPDRSARRVHRVRRSLGDSACDG